MPKSRVNETKSPTILPPTSNYQRIMTSTRERLKVGSQMAKANLNIIGDGQLGRMIASAAHAMGVRPVILGQSQQSPAGQVAPLVIGDYRNEETVWEFCTRHPGTTTFEFEDVNAN